jgi:potassium channel subfamily K, other eukaryote
MATEIAPADRTKQGCMVGQGPSASVYRWDHWLGRRRHDDSSLLVVAVLLLWCLPCDGAAFSLWNTEALRLAQGRPTGFCFRTAPNAHGLQTSRRRQKHKRLLAEVRNSHNDDVGGVVDGPKSHHHHHHRLGALVANVKSRLRMRRRLDATQDIGADSTVKHNRNIKGSRWDSSKPLPTTRTTLPTETSNSSSSSLPTRVFLPDAARVFVTSGSPLPNDDDLNEASSTSGSVIGTTAPNSNAITPMIRRQQHQWNTWMDLALSAAVRSIYLGMTLPFPQLRDTIVSQLDRSEAAAAAAAADNDNGNNQETATAPLPPSLGFSIRDSILGIASYLTIGVVAYSLVLEDSWSVVDALYFSVTTFTTNGFGDLHASTTASKLFTCVFGLGGVVFLSAALGTLGSNLVEVEVAAMEAAEKASRERLLDLFDNMPLIVRSIRSKNEASASASASASVVVEQLLLPKIEEENNGSVRGMMAVPMPSIWSDVRAVVNKIVPSFCFLFLGGFFMGQLEGWSIVDSIYYAIVTGLTIGFGDIAPNSEQARLWAVFFIPMAVAATGNALGAVASSFLARRRCQVYQCLMVDRNLCIDDLVRMDTDGNGRVTRDEYVEFMLLQLQLVDQEQLDELYRQFDRLDVTRSGYLDEEDLKLMAKLRRTSTQKHRGPLS